MGSPPNMSLAISWAFTMRSGYALCAPLIDHPEDTVARQQVVLLVPPSTTGACSRGGIPSGPDAAPRNLEYVYPRAILRRSQKLPRICRISGS